MRHLRKEYLDMVYSLPKPVISFHFKNVFARLILSLTLVRLQMW